MHILKGAEFKNIWTFNEENGIGRILFNYDMH